MNRSRTIIPATMLAVVALTAPTAVASAPTADPVVGQGESWILYQGFDGRHTDIRLVRPDGTGDHSPTTRLPGTWQTNPDWDPTGTRMTFIIREGGTEDLWVADIDGNHARKVLDCRAPCLYFDDPAWSPDGRSIVYSRTSSVKGIGVSTLETLDLASGRPSVRLGPWVMNFSAGARWSPDSGSIVFEYVHKLAPSADADIDGVVLTVLDLATGSTVGISDPALYAATADWSTDGSSIVYSALPTPGADAPDLYTVHPDGSGLTRLTHVGDLGGAYEPTFTRDGHSVVFSGVIAPDGFLQLAQVDVDGTHLRSATGDVTFFGRHPRMRPVPAP